MVKEDARFDKVLKDPRFKKIPHKEKKVKIDSRFQHMFTDEHFQQTYSVDKRGKPVQEKQGENLEKFYELESDEEDAKELEEKEEQQEDEVKSKEKKKKKKKKEGSAVDKGKGKLNVKKKKAPPPIELAEVSSSEDEEEESSSSQGPSKKAISFDDIRGANIAQDASSSEDEDNGDGYINRTEVGIEFEEGVVHGWGELDADARRIENAETARLAFCNCDWDKITATDVFVLCNSFKPPTGNINSVSIYPSDLGLERMREEDLKGPLLPSESEEEEEEAKDGGKSKGQGTTYHMEKLREYQLARLKYYYAVVECDSEDTANTLYEECDGMEYEMSATRLDIRFIPAETTFEDRQPHSACTEMPTVQTYQPTTFLNTALQQSTVRLTWDETDHKRQELMSKNISKKDIDEIDFKEYIGSSSESEEEAEKKVKADKYKALMDLVRSDDKVDDVDGSEEEGDMEVTFEPGMTFAGEDGDEGSKKKKGFVEKENKKTATKTKKPEQKKAPEPSDDDDEEEEDDHRSDLDENEETVAAFSDDDDEPSGFDDPFFKKGEDANAKKKKKKKKKAIENEEDMTEEELKQKKELELLLMQGETDDSRKHFSLKSIVENEKRLANKGNKRKKRKDADKVVEDDFEMDVKDDRFAAIYDQHVFALDPSQHHFKKTKATDALFEESQRRKKNKKQKLETESPNDSPAPTSTDNTSNATSLSSLVKSVKAKAKSHHINNKKKPKIT